MKLYQALPGVSENPLALLSPLSFKKGVGSHKRVGSVVDGQQPTRVNGAYPSFIYSVDPVTPVQVYILKVGAV